MNFQHFIWLYLWIAPHLLLVAVAVLMLQKGLHKDFPIFFSYLLFEFLQFCLLFALYSQERALNLMYVKVDMFSRAGSIALRFGILQELFESPLAHSVPLRRAAARILNCVTVVLVVLVSVFIGSLYYGILGHRVFAGYVVIEALNTAQCGLLALVFLWHRFLGLRMSPFVFGIALGMGLAAALEPFVLALNDSLALRNLGIPGLLHMAIYHVAVLVWLYFALAREKISSGSKADLPDLREWAADLGRIIHQ